MARVLEYHSDGSVVMRCEECNIKTDDCTLTCAHGSYDALYADWSNTGNTKRAYWKLFKRTSPSSRRIYNMKGGEPIYWERTNE